MAASGDVQRVHCVRCHAQEQCSPGKIRSLKSGKMKRQLPMQGEEREKQHMASPIFGLAIHNLLLRPGEGKADFPNRKMTSKAREKDQKPHGDEDIHFSLTMYL